MKKLSVFLALLCIMQFCVIDVNAKSVNNEQSNIQKTVLSENIKIKKIESLYKKRMDLLTSDLTDSEKIKQIEKIEKNLLKLGVEEISENDVENKIESVNNLKNKVSINNVNEGQQKITTYATIPGSRNGSIYWTSIRYKTMFNGRLHEVQLLKAQPMVNKSSPLSDYSVVCVKKTTPSKLVAGSTILLKVVAEKVVDKTPLGDGVQFLKTVYDGISSYSNAISRQTQINGLSASYAVNRTTEYTFAFVKLDGQTDQGHQVLSYAGNSSVITYQVSFPNQISTTNGVVISNDIRSYKVKGTVQSPFYNGSILTEACRYYNNKYSTGNLDYTVNRIKLYGINGDYIATYRYKPFWIY